MCQIKSFAVPRRHSKTTRPGSIHSVKMILKLTFNSNSTDPDLWPLFRDHCWSTVIITECWAECLLKLRNTRKTTGSAWNTTKLSRSKVTSLKAARPKAFCVQTRLENKYKDLINQWFLEPERYTDHISRLKPGWNTTSRYHLFITSWQSAPQTEPICLGAVTHSTSSTWPTGSLIGVIVKVWPLNQEANTVQIIDWAAQSRKTPVCLVVQKCVISAVLPPDQSGSIPYR